MRSTINKKSNKISDYHDIVANFLQPLRKLILISLDGFAVLFAFLGALWIRYSHPECFLIFKQALISIPLILILSILVFWLSGMYRTLWRYASVSAVYVIGFSTMLAVTVSTITLYLLKPFTVGLQFFLVQWMLLFLTVSFGRFAIRLIRGRFLIYSKKVPNKKLLIFGAGDAGEMLARDILRSGWMDLSPVGFVDDDNRKHGMLIHNIPVLGGRDKIAQIVKEKDISEVLVAMPSLSGKELSDIIRPLYQQLGSSVRLLTVPGTADLVDGTVSLHQVREFQISDLLRRPPVVLDYKRVDRIIKDQVVLVSGAGGSIGSEICRQVASFLPKKLIVVDISEPSAYEIQQELMGKFPKLDLITIVGDVCQRPLIERVFIEHHPHIVFHAAAYKHVPLMETNIFAAVHNNIRSTRVLSAVSADYKVERFVMISTDKAVRPTSVMGATKRVCEMIVEAQTHTQESTFCAVRFGNVMGSSGSVIPMFDKQIKKGGPVTVTHKDITRYFMLIPEAVQLVLQTATMNQNGAVYVLDMGEPVKIDDIAREMIVLSGKQPDKEIKIVYTGLRPGEKMYEELHHFGGGIQTEIEKIYVDDSPPLEMTANTIQFVDEILEDCYQMSQTEMLKRLRTLVPDFVPDTKPKTKSESPIIKSDGVNKGIDSPSID